MRPILGGLIAAALAFGQSPPSPAVQAGPTPATSTLTGAVNVGAGRDARPVRHARVTLQRDRDIAVRFVDTDAKGTYRFDGIQPARELRVMVEKPGFVTTAWTTVSAGARQLDVNLRRGAAIEGRVASDDGEPVLDAAVTALRINATTGKPETVTQSRTDDLGRFRLYSLAAGKYFVRAEWDQERLAMLRLVPGEKLPESAEVFYPSSATLDQANPITLEEASDVRGIDLVMALPAPVIDPAVSREPAPRHDQSGRIAGRVTAADTGKPIRGAMVGVLSYDVPNWGKAVRTDAQGRYVCAGLAAGRYRVNVSAESFSTLTFGERRPGDGAISLDLKEGEAFLTADVSLPRLGAIEGAVSDEFGDPAPHVPVSALRPRFVAGRTRLVPLQARGQQQVTNDRGYFRLYGVPPGEYYLVAQAGVFADQNDAAGYAPTYYPGTPDARAAARVTVPPGGDAPTATAVFALTPAKTVKVSGTLVGASGAPTGRGQVLLTISDSLGRPELMMKNVPTGPDGRFTFRNVPSGTYTIQGYELHVNEPPVGRAVRAARRSFGWVKVQVGDADVDGIVVRTGPGHVLRGRIVVDDSSAPAPRPSDVRISQMPLEFDSAALLNSGLPQDIRDDLSYEAYDISGLCRLVIEIRSGALTLRRLVLNGRDVTDQPIDLREHDVDGLDIILTPKVSHVTGAILDDRGRSRTDYAVVIFSADSSHWMDGSRFVASGRPSEQGRFDIKGLPPEDYLAVALPEASATEYFDPDFLETLRPLATSFSLGDGESKTITLAIKKRP